MLITLKQLKTFMDKATKIAPNRSTLPILTDVYIGKGNMVATNIEHFIVMPLRETISCTIPIRHLKTLLKLKPDVIEILKGEDHAVILKFDGKSLKVQGHDPDEFPLIPDGDFKSVMELKESFIKELNKQLPYVSTDMLRPALTGIMLRLNNDVVTCATDGHVLRTTTLNGKTNQDLQLIIPALSVRLLNQKPIGPVVMSFNEGQMLKFDLDGMTLYSRNIDEKYPDWESVIPKSFDHNVTIPIAELIEAVKTAQPFVSKDTQQLRLEVNNNGLNLHAKDVEDGSELSQEVSIQESNLNGETVEIAYNANYLLQVLKSIETDSVKWNFSKPINPTTFTEPDNNQSINLLMPIRLQDE